MNIPSISESSFGAPWLGCPKAAPGALLPAPPSLGLVKGFGSRIFSIARHITQNDEDAEQVLIETFLAVCSAWDGCEDEEGLWLRLVTAAVREAFANVRKCVAGPRLGQGPDCEDLVIRELFRWEDDYPQRYSKQQMTRVLENGLRSLGPMARTVFVLRDIEQISVEFIAGVVNRSVADVEVWLLRARLQLRESLARQMKQPSNVPK